MTAPAINMKFEPSMTEAQAMARLQRARKRRDDEMALLRKKAAARRRDAIRYSRKVIQLPEVILTSFVEELERDGKRVGEPHGTTALHVIGLSKGFDIWAKTAEPVQVVQKLRPNDKTRTHFIFGLFERVRSRILHRVAKVLTAFHPNQFALCGGRPALVNWLIKHLGETELVITTDIPDFFHRANRASIEGGLPLPREVTRAALFQTMDRAEAAKNPKDYLKVSGTLSCLKQTGIVAVSPKGRGTPSGAALSQIATDILIREILNAVEAAVPGVLAGAHGDNLIFLLSDVNQKLPVIEATTSAVQLHVGQDVISGLTDRICSAKPSSWFQFCGVKYRWRKAALEQKTTEERMDNYAVRFLTNALDAKTDDDYDHLRRSLRSWAGQYKQFPEAFSLALELASHLPPPKSG